MRLLSYQKWIGVLALSLMVGSLAFFPKAALAKNSQYPVCSFKPSVAVDQFRTENIYVGWDEFAGNARDVVVNDLTNSGCWRVVERGESGIVSSGYDREQAIKGVGTARHGQKGARSGQVTLADKLVQCALTGVTHNQVGGSLGGFGFGNAGGFGGGSVAPRASNISITCRIYDSSTSEVLASVQKDKSKVDIGASGFGGPGGFALGGDFFYKDPVGKTIAALIHDTLIDLTNRVQKSPWAAN
jgi:curli biogenesis system outer membrane secretion channel CsgG